MFGKKVNRSQRLWMTMNRDHNDTLKLKDYKDTRILQMSWSIDYISYSLVVAEQLQKAL